MRVGNLVKLPKGHFWWNSRVGVISQVRMGCFSNDKGENVVKEECKVEFGDNFIWYWDCDELEVLSVG